MNQFVAMRSIDLKGPAIPGSLEIPCSWCLAPCPVSPDGRRLMIAQHLAVVCVPCLAATGEKTALSLYEKITGAPFMSNPIETLEARGAKSFTGPRCSHQRRNWTPILGFQVDGKPTGDYWVPAEYCEACTAVIDAEVFGSYLSAAAGLAPLPGRWMLRWVRVSDVAALFTPKNFDVPANFVRGRG